MDIGKVVKSNSHTDYVCQVYGPGEVEYPPSVEDYAFGRFVQIALPTQPQAWLVGLIYDTILLNPDFGRLGPRLSPPSDLAVFSPDYLNEKVTLVGIMAIGMTNAQGSIMQGIPPYAANTDAMVETMSEQQIRDFHMGNPTWRLAYMPYLASRNSVETRYLAQQVLTQLRTLFSEPEQTRIIDLMLDEIMWNNQVAPLGGRA
ncbi:MAG TPA: hypothetical protein PKW33_11800 [Anaerolineaceae bacterium]|nr:hypothetical protein [Anaerolineaceae bacterium]HPN52263.1 hypothetical protein [Anaerolineaceae bacterium]